jgi:HSP20 family protein
MKETSLVPFRDNWRELDDYFDRTFGRFPRLWRGERELEWRPATDISETASEFLVKAELPEVKKEDISVELDGNTLTIKGERKQEKEDKSTKVHRVERTYGSFMRSFTLPENVDGKAITAEVKDGVLHVHLPKVEVPKPAPTKVAIK